MERSAVVIGSLNMDIAVTVERLPAEGETLQGVGLVEAPGGKGANQAAAIGKLQTPVRMIGKVGADRNGAALLQSLEASGVDTDAVLTSSGQPTGVALVTVDRAGRNHIVVVPGANGELTKDDIDSRADIIEQCDMIVLQLEVPLETVAYALRKAKALGKTTVLNPAPARKLDDELLQFVDFLIPNEHELQTIAELDQIDEQSIERAARLFGEKGVGALIVTMGERGCCYADRSKIKAYPARKVNAVDTTAAGDSFIGGFVAGYLASRDADTAIRQAQIAAAITVTRHGAQSSLPTRQEVEALWQVRTNSTA
ncbi:ribokinase [Paenibacillus oceani]|uniref:Ribokinase n=1 Tax=Paenibacillus oceani TaxID=2772510 RepID=A0A927H203_9BACL|nr:ribokinase [Paenibacillus oceani]MBD2864752.1 ribokinase [Paenibacillus oceani]